MGLLYTLHVRSVRLQPDLACSLLTSHARARGQQSMVSV
jgi:hypothetical protein